MKRLFVVCLVCVSLSSMKKPPIGYKHLLHEAKNLMHDYKASEFELAMTRINQFLKVPAHSRIEENPLFMADLLAFLSKKFKKSMDVIALQLGTPGSRLWLKINIAQKEQQQLAHMPNLPVMSSSIKSLLLDGFENGDEKTIISILKNYKPYLNDYLFNPETLLMKAAWYNLYTVARYLVNNNVAVNAPSMLSRATPLIYVVGNSIRPKNQIKIVELLLNKGANPNLVGNGGINALALAAQHNKTAIMELLLVAGARVNITDHDGNTPLMSALLTPGVRDETVLLLLGHYTPEDLDIVNKKGESALIIAMNLNRTDILQELLNRGATISPQVLSAADKLPDDRPSKKDIIKALRDKLDHPHLNFGAARIDAKLL